MVLKHIFEAILEHPMYKMWLVLGLKYRVSKVPLFRIAKPTSAIRKMSSSLQGIAISISLIHICWFNLSKILTFEILWGHTTPRD